MPDPILLHRGSAESILLQLDAAANLTTLANTTVRFLLRRAGRVATLLDVPATIVDAVLRKIQVDLTAAQMNTLVAGDHEAQVFVYRAAFPNDPIVWPLEQDGCASSSATDGGAYPVSVLSTMARLP